jgi:spermidine synthase
MTRFTRRFLFLVFFLSGCCALIYQVVWTRLAFASFGIIAPVLSVVLSVFMFGLGGGAWAGGRWIGRLTRRTGCSALLFYALAECMIGIGALSVPTLFRLGEQLLLSSGQADSLRYLSFSALALGLSILPWCVFMGATFPFMMAYAREQDQRSSDSFSYLYLANVLGAMAGCLFTALFFVELLGFKGTLLMAAMVNFAIAATSGYLAWKQPRNAAVTASRGPKPKSSRRAAHTQTRPALLKWILFSTGFGAMAMEVIWARAFTPVLTTQVYSFALILFTYLGGTFFGSVLYRRDLRKGPVRAVTGLVALLSVAIFLPIICNDARILIHRDNMANGISAAVLLLSIFPFCAVLGYLTPRLIDEYSLGDPASAGQAYGVNVAGCILGPLFASYILLPWLGEHFGLILLGVPFLAFSFFGTGALWSWRSWGWRLTAGALACWSLLYTEDYAQLVLRKSPKSEIRRDYAASVISAGQGFSKVLLVNGIGMTGLVPITKFMAHLPLAFHTGKPESALIICFGMGTSYRSALTWDIETTAVELVPSVRDAFEFYHADAKRVLSNAKGHIVIDDGRRYLARSGDKFDVIVIDPPPPAEAAGSSLLYSEEFYERAKEHLRPNGILQAWFPGGDNKTGQAVLRSLRNSFPYLRCFASPENSGILILASRDRIADLNAYDVAMAMPSAAADDLLEWSSTRSLHDYLSSILATEIPIEQALDPDPRIRIADDRPFNEYYLLRRWDRH